MVDGITIRADGKAEMAYVGKKPWHNHGNELKPGASIQEWLVSAGLNWQILKSQVRWQTNPNEQFKTLYKFAKFPNQHVLFRSDNLKPLSIVSDSYEIVQPEQILRYFERLTQKAGFVLDTAGSLFDGKQFWALASIGAESQILSPKDKVKGRLLLCSSADTSLPTTGKFICERVVCANTLAVGLNETGNAVKVQHKRVFDASELNEKLGIDMREQFPKQIELFRKLARTHMPAAEMVKASIELYTPGAFDLPPRDFVKARKKAMVRRIAEIGLEHETIGGHFKGCNETAWEWLNCVTQFIDHENASRSTEWRLHRAWFGTGSNLKQRALKLATEFAEGNLNLSSPDGDDNLVNDVVESFRLNSREIYI